MKNVIILGMCLVGLGMIQSCGKVDKNYKTVESVEIVEKTVEVEQRFEGMFYLGSSYIEVYQRNNSIYITSTQLLTTTNPLNTTFGELPKVNGEYEIIDNKVRLSKNLNYTSGQDIEEDVSGNNILGQRRTDITLEFIDSKLNITFEIYANKIGNNVNYIIAKRVFTQD